MRNRRWNSEDGFTLVEVILSLALLGIGAMLLAFVLGGSVRMLGEAANMTTENASDAGQTEEDAAGTAADSNEMTISFDAGTVTVSGEYSSNGPYTVFVPS